MKKILSFFLGLFSIITLSAQTTYTIDKGTGFTFSPSELTVVQGDIVHFNLASPHAVTQVSLATWNADGTTQLAGGFSFPTGSGDYTTSTPGVIYYVCPVHVTAYGMKGSIVVNAITGIKDILKNNKAIVYPNPARDFITYQAKSNSSVQEIRIIDITGKAVKILNRTEISDDHVRIDIGNLDKGLYFILVRSANGVESGKFLKS